MANCWAEVLGNCDTKISREHVISESFFTTPSVKVQGLPWCETEPKIIGLSSATAKILCCTHNSELSPLDSEIGKFTSTVREFMRISEVRSKLVPTPLQIRRFTVNARLLERWLLKVLLNLTFEGRYLIGWEGTEIGRPPDHLVRVAFGLNSFDSKAGMYVGAHVGLTMSMGEYIEFSPLLKNDKYVLGGFFKVGGILLYLCLDPAGVTVPFNQTPVIDEQWSSADLKWRFRKIQAKHGRYLSHVIEFKW